MTSLTKNEYTVSKATKGNNVLYLSSRDEEQGLDIELDMLGWSIVTIDDTECHDYTRVTLTQDNRDKLSIKATVYDIEYYAKKFFRWRTPTKYYYSILDRLRGQGSSDYDDFIDYMYDLGFNKEVE